MQTAPQPPTFPQAARSFSPERGSSRLLYVPSSGYRIVDLVPENLPMSERSTSTGS